MLSSRVYSAGKSGRLLSGVSTARWVRDDGWPVSCVAGGGRSGGASCGAVPVRRKGEAMDVPPPGMLLA